MAQIKLMKINSSGLPEEMDITADEVTLLSYTVDGGGPVLSGTGLDMNNANLSDVDDISFTDPTTDGITRTDGTHAIDDAMFQDAENTMAVGAAVLFPTVTDAADELDAFRLPTIAGAPSATPADGGEGYAVFDSTNNAMYIWDGSTWANTSIVEDAERVCSEYTAGVGISQGEVVYISAADTAALADVSGAGAASRVVGVASTTALAAAPVRVCTDGAVPGFTGLTAGDRYFSDPSSAGAVTTTVPVGSGNKIIQIGYAKNTTTMDLQIAYLGRRA